MARQPRIHLPGAVYHVMLRGNGGQDIFFENDDYTYLYGLLEESIRRFGYRVHGGELQDTREKSFLDRFLGGLERKMVRLQIIKEIIPCKR